MREEEARARQALALFLAEQYAELVREAAARCEAAGEPLSETQALDRLGGAHVCPRRAY